MASSSGKLLSAGNLSAAVLGASFLIGALLGALAAERITKSGAFELYGAILRFTMAAKTGGLDTSFLPNFARCFGLIAFSAAAGLTTYSVVALPAVFSLKGFTFSYTICAFCAVLGKSNGILVSLAVCGLRNIFVMFGLVLLSADFYAKTLAKERRRAGTRFFYPDKEYAIRTLMAFASAGAALLCDLAMTPSLVSAVAGLIP